MFSHMFPFIKPKSKIGTNMHRLVTTALDCSFVLRQSLTLTVLKGVKMSIIMFCHNFNATVFPLKFVKYSKMLMGLQRYIFLRQRITYASLMTNPARFQYPNESHSVSNQTTLFATFCNSSDVFGM